MNRFSEKVSENVKNPISIYIDRKDAERGRHKTTVKGEDIIIELPRGVTIDDGDIFGPSENGSFFEVNISPENVVKVNVRGPAESDRIETAYKLGYELGNRHMQIIIDGDSLYIPVLMGEEKVKGILETTKLPLKIETMNRKLRFQHSSEHGHAHEHGGHEHTDR